MIKSVPTSGWCGSMNRTAPTMSPSRAPDRRVSRPQSMRRPRDFRLWCSTHGRSADKPERVPGSRTIWDFRPAYRDRRSRGAPMFRHRKASPSSLPFYRRRPSDELAAGPHFARRQRVRSNRCKRTDAARPLRRPAAVPAIQRRRRFRRGRRALRFGQARGRCDRRRGRGRGPTARLFGCHADCLRRGLGLRPRLMISTGHTIRFLRRIDVPWQG
jgi:hypothetical protein